MLDLSQYHMYDLQEITQKQLEQEINPTGLP